MSRETPAPRERQLFRSCARKPSRPAIAPACAAVPRRWTEIRNPRWSAPCAATSSSTLEDRLTLGLLAKEFRRSPFHLQRTFKSVLGVSPKAYIDACRLRQVKQNLQAGHAVTTALYAAGYGSSSRLYERTAAQLGMTPEKYRRGAVAAVVRYTIADSPLGRMLIAATDKGICAIQFADSDQQLQQGLIREFPFAVRRRDDPPWPNGERASPA